MLTIAEAAALAGVAPATWRAYVARGQAPRADEQDRWGHPLWRPTTVEAWIAARPGSGRWRTDLKEKVMTTYAVIASCPYRDEVRRYDIEAESEAEAHTEAARRYGHEPTIGVEPADVVTEGA